MEWIILAVFAVFIHWKWKSQDQGRRIALLAHYLGHYQIEKHMETLTQGYLRALGEDDPQRREQIFGLLRTTEKVLSEQFGRFAAEISQASEADTRVSKFAIYLPFVTRLIPQATFDLRKAMAIHARGIARAAEGEPQASDRDMAFTMSAELFLMQHTCHWFCKSKTVASARMLAGHKTSHEQLVASVAPETRADYRALVGS